MFSFQISKAFSLMAAEISAPIPAKGKPSSHVTALLVFLTELIIVFREVLEGSLIVGILFTYLKKTDQKAAISKLWQGVTAAIVASIIVVI